jgi:hypothetical protein
MQPSDAVPTKVPTVPPTENPSTQLPSEIPTISPTTKPPTNEPTPDTPTALPFTSPSTTEPSISVPTVIPSHLPSQLPTITSTDEPTTASPLAPLSLHPTTAIPTVVAPSYFSSRPTASPVATIVIVFFQAVNMEVEGGCNVFLEYTILQQVVAESIAEAMEIDASYVIYIECEIVNESNRRNLQSSSIDAVKVTTQTNIPMTEVSVYEAIIGTTTDDTEAATQVYLHLKTLLESAMTKGNFMAIVEEVSQQKEVSVNVIVDVSKAVDVGSMELVHSTTKAPTSVESSSTEGTNNSILYAIIGVLLVIVFIFGGVTAKKYLTPNMEKVYASGPGEDNSQGTGVGTGQGQRLQDEEYDIGRVYPTEIDVAYDMPPIAISVQSGAEEEQPTGVAVTRKEVATLQSINYQGPITVHHHYRTSGGKILYFFSFSFLFSFLFFSFLFSFLNSITTYFL